METQSFLINGIMELANSWPNFVLFSIFSIGLYRMFKKEMDRLSDKFEIILSSKEELSYLRENFEQVKQVKDMINNPDSIYSILDSLVTNLINQLNSNFSNGSSLQKALNDCDDFHMQVLEILNIRQDIEQSSRTKFVVLAEVVYEEMVKLTNQLSLLTDYTIKPKLLIPFGKNIRSLVNYFGISLYAKYKGLPDKAIKTDLIHKLRSLGTRLEVIRNPFSGV